ncbi:inositol polyphosphate multikinase isoform X2 [Amyelois transitella]|uniref:inositol polyphosphate multikinase isoform X2 n=1 Tax=Amyelois transitella TaxID=680683 RepID=UPI00298F6DD4|nr:inositol polyphosphate multikinase isoform X2 [Amyelois transitella]
MSDVRRHQPVRWQRSIHSVHYNLPRQETVITKPLKMPSEQEIQAYDRQVAGHTATNGKKYLGRRTWDPLATEEKIKNEQTKYALCKQEYAFCIPGFQVYRLATGQLHKYGKDYGKKLHGEMVRDALKKYLNVSEGVVCRALLLRILSSLWQIQKWARTQRAVKLYSTSLLLVYDAAKLRECCVKEKIIPQPKSSCQPPLRRRSSIHSTHSPAAGASFSGQLSHAGPVYKKVSPVPLAPLTPALLPFTPPTPINTPWNDVLEKLNHNHSFDHNYEDKLSKMKMNFRATLDQMSSDTPNPNPWGTVKIIDFAHAFFNEDDDATTDDNFSEGIDNFVKIFESFLRETSDQII